MAAAFTNVASGRCSSSRKTVFAHHCPFMTRKENDGRELKPFFLAKQDSSRFQRSGLRSAAAAARIDDWIKMLFTNTLSIKRNKSEMVCIPSTSALGGKGKTLTCTANSETTSASCKSAPVCHKEMLLTALFFPSFSRQTLPRRKHFFFKPRRMYLPYFLQQQAI